MKQIDCDVIQDLLPSYSDKVSSDATNKLIEEHLKTCKKCSIALNNMNKEIDTEIVENQDEQIDYLKEYRKNKIRTIIFAITLTIDIILGIFIVSITALDILTNAKLFVDVNDVNVEYMFTHEDDETKRLEVYLYSEKYKKHLLDRDKYEVVDDAGNREIYLKIAVEALPSGLFNGDSYYSGTNQSIKLDDNVKEIYIEDKKGNLKEIWNKDMKVMTEDEWRHWYIDSYAPQEIVKEYRLRYDLDINSPRWYYTSFWRHLYEPGK